MKFSASAILFLLPFMALATPTPDLAELAPIEEGQDTPGVSPVPEAGELFARCCMPCAIVNVSSYANCRSGPGTGYSVVKRLKKGQYYRFKCYKRGTCVSNNCTWDKYEFSGGSCYVSGSLTDKFCDMGSLGLC